MKENAGCGTQGAASGGAESIQWKCHHRSAYRADNMALNRATFNLRRRRSLGFS